MPKQVYTWGKVTAGDIISFRYKGKQPTGTLTTISWVEVRSSRKCTND